jgi:hypothetical protein
MKMEADARQKHQVSPRICLRHRCRICAICLVALDAYTQSQCQSHLESVNIIIIIVFIISAKVASASLQFEPVICLLVSKLSCSRLCQAKHSKIDHVCNIADSSAAREREGCW